ncbi:DUF1707 SHOCT-like domain-containing protein [Parafrankia elaeagni]|uniref:DUF1707 SHOCT-like domain-containing protein n=1 Tax=Parafrankia elaeagni TaxID=222534 RepID=UPI00038146F0|nr:DUF1707 domain-containing protein [Parafrankia elaeagni]
MFPALPEPVTDGRRRACTDRLRTACAAGLLTFGEFSEGVGRVWAAQTAADLERIPLAGGDAGPRGGALGEGGGETVDRTRAEEKPRSTIVSLLGDGRRLGRWRMARRTLVVNVLGNWTLDLRGALPADQALADRALDLRFVSLIGDLTLTVPDGVTVETTGLVVLGDQQVDLAGIRERPGMPRVRVRLACLIGDVRITSGSRVGRPDRNARSM